MVAFLVSIVITMLMVAVIVVVGKRRPPGTPLTWGEAFVAATYVTALLLVLYGIVPNEWLRWSDSELQWRKDAFFVAPGSSLHKLTRVVIPKEVVRDIVATLIYVVGVVGHVKMWMWWQARGKKVAAAPEAEQSAFGRPLVKADA